MSVLLETSLGDLVIDLHTSLAPRSCTNFLKLCSSHYYKLNAFFSVSRDFTAQTGDPTNTGKGGRCIWSQLPSGSRDRIEDGLFRPEMGGDGLKHTAKGTVSFACVRGGDEDGLVAGSQFFITLKDEIEYLDGRHAPFGVVVEGQEPGGTLDRINEAFVDDSKRPLRDIWIRHVVVLEDPFPDPDGFVPPSRSPSPTPSQVRALRLADEEDNNSNTNLDEEARRAADTTAAALTLEMVGDLPFAEIRPPENILFVCKLNPVTRSDDLELIFSRFGKIMSCEVVKDRKTGDSLQYAFVEFDRKEDAERAYFKMQNVLVDDRRIWVDFSQSVGRLHGEWVKKRTGGREVPKGRNGGAGQVDSYRPSDGGDSRGSGRDGRDDERGHKRSRRDGEHRDSGPSKGYEREDEDRRRKRYDEDRSSHRASHRRREDEERRYRDRSPRRHGSGRSDRRDRDHARDYGREHHRDRERNHDRTGHGHAHRENDRDRERHHDRSRQ